MCLFYLNFIFFSSSFLSFKWTIKSLLKKKLNFAIRRVNNRRTGNNKNTTLSLLTVLLVKLYLKPGFPKIFFQKAIFIEIKKAMTTSTPEYLQ